MLGRLKARFGVYAVLGNHDHWTDAALITDLFRAEGMTVLINEGMHFELDGDSIWLAGWTIRWSVWKTCRWRSPALVAMR